MKDILRQLAIIITTVMTLIVNTLANTLPINGLDTGEISDRFNVYFVPAGYVFSIWGLIYIGLIAFNIFQALPAQRENPRLRAIGWWVVLSNIANTVWIFLWHYEQFPVTLIAMFTLLASLIFIYLGLRKGNPAITTMEKWMARVPFSIYLGWITVATVANITSVLDFVNWNRFGISEEVWMGIILAAVLAIVAVMNFTRRDIGYTAVILWALAGIAYKFASIPAVLVPTLITFALVAVTFGAAYYRQPPARRLVRAA